MIRLFGTDGVRGRAGSPPLDAATLRRIGAATGAVLGRGLGRPPRVAIGRDTRESGPALLAAVAAGLVDSGSSVRSAGVVPTPAVSLLARSDDFDAGVVLSASHNPWQDNGLKIFSSSGGKLTDNEEEAIEQLVASGAWSVGGEVPAPPDEPDLAARHAAWLGALAARRGWRFDGLCIAIDCANGAASSSAGPLLAGLGAVVTTIAAAPDGRNINDGCGSLHLEGLAHAVRTGGHDLGFALDGDADRVLFVDGAGATVDGDAVLLILADALQERAALSGHGVVGTVMSNLGLERALAARGITLLRERVGDRHVLSRMQSAGHVLGGEPSGHVILLDDAPTGDGLLTALHVLAACLKSGRPLAELAAGLERCPQRIRNVRAAARLDLASLEGHAGLVERWSTRLGQEGRIVVRWSGTEPLVRVMVEATDGALVEACVTEISANLEAALFARGLSEP